MTYIQKRYYAPGKNYHSIWKIDPDGICIFLLKIRIFQPAMLVSGSAQLLGITFLVGKKSLYKQLQISWSEMAK